jgi:hypothetical protein
LQLSNEKGDSAFRLGLPNPLTMDPESVALSRLSYGGM